MLVEGVAGIGHHITLEGCAAVALCYLDGVEFVDIGGCSVAHALGSPLEAHVAGQDALSLGRFQKFADGIEVANRGVAYDTSG